MVGYGILLSDSSSGIRYFGCFVVTFGLYVIVGIPLAWLPANNPRYGKRTTATGLQLTIGNASGIMSPYCRSFLYKVNEKLMAMPIVYKTAEGPQYVRGHAVTLGLVGAASLIYGVLWWFLVNENRKRREGQMDHLIANLSEGEIDELGDRSPKFMYTV